MKSSQLRQAYLDFFKTKEHVRVRSDHLVPQKDPTLLFTTAGMVQFKPLYMGAPMTYSRAVSVQKCLRAGGKDSDLENVGKTLRHHTFFEMLGNFSFGDYFKREAITWAWDFINNTLELPTDKLWVSVYKDDEESAKLWLDTIGFPKEHLVYLGDADNFWGPAGGSGACGPCSELHIDLGPERDPSVQEGDLENGGERYFEFWNLVFPQYNQLKDGSREALERRGIDTGMGLERLTFIMQYLNGTAQSNYETDLFAPIIEKVSAMSGVAYHKDAATDYAMHVIADHIRALTFTFAENLIPSNEGRGYVLRRILRRAYRFGSTLQLKEPFLYTLVPTVVSIMGEVYPEIKEAQAHVQNLIQVEEESFQKTLQSCEVFLEDILSASVAHKQISGRHIFKLYDTYGLPLDMLADIAEERGYTIDQAGFDVLMQEQKERARQGWSGGDKASMLDQFNEILTEHGETRFLGYQSMQANAQVLAVIEDSEAEQSYVITDQTPFYAESGGQSGDHGRLVSASSNYAIVDTQQFVAGLSVHVFQGILKDVAVGDTVSLGVDSERRRRLSNNHTVTHILQSVLKQELGNDIRQAGSLVEEDYLRFDFSYFEAIPEEALRCIEDRVNQYIWSNATVAVDQKTLDQAKEEGALSFFDEKYGDTVRMISVGDFSKELCGGTHVPQTGQIGFFKITNESSVAAGTRRITALTGEAAMRKVYCQENVVAGLKKQLKASEDELFERVAQLQKNLKDADKRLQQAAKNAVLSELDDLETDVFQHQDASVWSKLLTVSDGSVLKDIHDCVRHKQEDWILILAANVDGKGQFVVSVPKERTKQGWHAGHIVKALATRAGGGGGGRPDLAQAGCKDASSLPDIMKDLASLLSEVVSA